MAARTKKLESIMINLEISRYYNWKEWTAYRPGVSVVRERSPERKDASKRSQKRLKE